MAIFNVSVLEGVTQVNVGENTFAAAASATRAENAAAAAEAFAGPAFANTTDGIAGTVNGEFFAVDNAGIVTIYRNSAGTAVAQRTLATTTALAAATGSTLVGFIQSGTGAEPRDVQAKLRETVSVKDFGAVGNGVADDTPAIQAAIDSLGALGGTVIIPNGMKCLIDTDLAIKPNVSLVGPHKFVGSPQDNISAPYGSMGGALIINSAVTVTLNGGASVSGLLVYRKGMAFPAADASAFAGRAFQTAGDDAAVTKCMILGFNQFFYSIDDNRQRIEKNCIDCINGVYIENCLDNPRVNDNHAWPFATIATVSKPSNWADRAGVAYHFKNTADWLSLNFNFSYGWLTGTKIEACNHFVLNCPQADGTTAYANSVGIHILGTAGGNEDGVIIAPRVAAQTLAGIRINNLDGIPCAIIGGAVWNSGTHGVWLENGDLSVSQTMLRDMGNGITVNSANSRVFRNAVRFDNVTSPINATVSTANLYGGWDDFIAAAGTPLVGANGVIPTIASADPMGIPTAGQAFNVTGTNSTGTIQGGYAGRMVTLIFSGVLTIFGSTGSTNAVRLASGGNYTSAANSTLTIAHNGVQWFEVARSA
jgi:hypothetical protein